MVGAGARGSASARFVVPGATACLRCVDAHLAERDPRRGVVVEQLAGRAAAPGATTRPRGAGGHLGGRDALRYLAGAAPATWSATVGLDGAAAAAPRVRGTRTAAARGPTTLRRPGS